jgi:heme exporter protein D
LPSATPYWLLDRIKLDYRASIVSLDFGALDFISPKRNRLAYRVAGSQRSLDRSRCAASRDAHQPRCGRSLARGARSQCRFGVERAAAAYVHRDPAPWRSPWAYALYALAVLLFAAHRVRAHRAKIRGIVEAKQRLESEVACARMSWSRATGSLGKPRKRRAISWRA